MQILYCPDFTKEKNAKIILEKAIQKFSERTGCIPDTVIAPMAYDTILKQKFQKLPKGHFILSYDEN